MFEIGKVYTFNTLAPAILGTQIKNAKCIISGMSSTVARKFEPIDQKYRQIYPSLPQGTVDDVNAAEYYLFEAENGSNVVFANQWIDVDSVVVVDHQAATVYIPEITPQQLTALRSALISVGIFTFNVQVTHV